METKMLNDLRSVKGDHFYNPYQKSLDLPEGALGVRTPKPGPKIANAEIPKAKK